MHRVAWPGLFVVVLAGCSTAAFGGGDAEAGSDDASGAGQTGEVGDAGPTPGPPTGTGEADDEADSEDDAGDGGTTGAPAPSGSEDTGAADGSGAEATDGEESGETGGAPPDATVCGYLELPAAVGSVLSPAADVDALEAAVASAMPGDRIEVAPGTYDDVELSFAHGDVDGPAIVVAPADPDEPPIFTGRNEATGDHFTLMGLRFDATGTGTGGRMLRLVNTHAATLAYLQFDKTDNIGVELSGNVWDTLVHRSWFHGTGVHTNAFGSSAIKAGVKSAAGQQRGTRIECSRFEDVIDNRETISVKEGGVTIFGCTFDNTHDVVARHATRLRVEQCTGMRRITVNGPDHVIVNSHPEDAVEVWSGSHDGGADYGSFPEGSGSVYLSGHDVRIEHCSGALRIGEDSYQGGAFVADGTVVAEHASEPELFGGATYTAVAADTEAVEPIVIESSDVALSAYIEHAL